MRNMILLILLMLVPTVHAEVSASDDKLVRSYMQELIKFSLQPISEERIQKQIQSFNQNVDIGIEESGAIKFNSSNRWASASEKAKQQYRNVMAFFISQIFVNKFRELLLSVGNKELAEKIRIDAEKGASMRITNAQDKKRHILQIVLFPDIVPVAYHSRVSFDLQVENGKIVDIILGDLRTSEKSDATEATLRKTVMGIVRSNTSQFVTYDSEVERQIKNDNAQAVEAYTRLFLTRYLNVLKTHHAAKSDLSLDFLINN